MSKPTYEELEAQLHAAISNEREWETAMMQACGEDGPKSVAEKFAELKSQLHAVVAELSAVEEVHNEAVFITDEDYDKCPKRVQDIIRHLAVMQVPAYQDFVAALRAESRKEGAIFAANRMLAAWDAGFVEDTPENAADIARAILSMTEFMDDAPAGDFDRSFADEMLAILAAIAAQLRQSVQVKGVQS